MYISSISLKNFRAFDSTEREICFNPGLTLLVGENDSGKSAVVDALKIVLGTTDLGWYRIKESDFHNEDISKEIEISCKFMDLSDSECSALLEYLTYEKNKDGERYPVLYLKWSCKYLQSMKPPRPIIHTATGLNGDGPSLSPEAKELLRVTHLKALRDAYSDMQSGRNSRLSQVIQNLPNLNVGNDEYETGDDPKKLSLIGIFNLSNQLLTDYEPLKKANSQMSTILQRQMLLEGDNIITNFEVSGVNTSDVRKTSTLLEKLDLTINKEETDIKGLPGLGTSNIMSMACELLLKKNTNDISQFLLIEEPESHIHAQRQLKLIKSLQQEAETANQQIIMTTHSPLLASVVKLENIVIIKNSRPYSLAKKHTKLDEDDYIFLEKYLDATKANLFFARSVMIVEGPGEALLIPTLSRLLKRDFTDYGVSLVDVRSTGLRRYSKIFQRNTSESSEWLDINVACVTDSDVMPDCAPKICIKDIQSDDIKEWPSKEKRQWIAESDFKDEDEKEQHLQKIRDKANGQLVKTFISDQWTLEYDLAYSGLNDQNMKSVLLAALVNSTYAQKNRASKKTDIEETISDYTNLEEKASYFYSFFTSGKTSKADFAQHLAIELEKAFIDNISDLTKTLPQYLLDSIYYVTEEPEVK
ncbi:hypothetical protein WV34_03695 [Bacillus amyloliquefaciens]|uniref:ATP-dependent nuclease n=1 Tax=Bacillus amyloliquefaciens group TaxID=1938374 RepID=UPI000B51A991|nr:MULTISPECIES: AAA family ATPase [Bacillus amyloliquefaciens group]ASF27924.1 hypothetical protein WV34_03695 [Bacillus amyloliquefaciens]